LIALIGCLSWLITYVLPQSYSAIEFLIVACMVQPLFLMISEVSGIGISVSRATKLLPVITIAAFLLNVGLNLWLIPLYGAAGAAAATAVSTALYLLLKTELSWHLWRPQPRARLYLSMLLLVTGCIVQALSSNIGTLYFVAMWAAFSAFFLYIYKEVLLKLKPLTFGLS
jgi:O-antigen/teichoic acid export membrane protein